MKLLPARRALRAPLVAFATAAALLALASLPWRAERPVPPPRVVASTRGSGPLSAGAAEVRFALPEGVPIAGFARLSYGSEGAAGPVGARALVLRSGACSVAIASAELLLVTDAMDAAVRTRTADLGLGGLVVAATHTHAGPGGFWRHAVAERIATGRYDPRAEEAIVAALADAIRRAAGALAPARVSVGRGSAGELARSRSGGAEDAPLTVLRLERTDGGPIAEVTVFASHATLLGKRNHAISGDWPGSYLADGGARGVRLLLQGAIGDQSAEGPASRSPEAYAAALSSRVAALPFGPPDPAPPLAVAAVETALPSPEPAGVPRLLRPAARNVAFGALPAAVRVHAIRLGPALLVAVPAEPVASVAAGWRASLPAGAAVLSLAGGYVGYVEEPDRVTAGVGESVRTYYGPRLAATLGAAVAAAARAADGPG